MKTRLLRVGQLRQRFWRATSNTYTIPNRAYAADNSSPSIVDLRQGWKWFIPRSGPIPEPTAEDKKLAKRLFSRGQPGSTKFLGTALKVEQFKRLNSNSAEVAFMGRSNVGKSSLINALLELDRGNSKETKKNRAFVSNAPGKTVHAQFFGVDEKTGWKARNLPHYGVVVVDLPGYGYARGDMQRLNEMSEVISQYVIDRNVWKLCGIVYLLIDSKVGLTKLDKEMMKMLDDYGMYYQIVLTKLDKLKLRENETPSVVESVLEYLDTGQARAANLQVLGVSTKKGVRDAEGNLQLLGIRQLRQEIARTVYDVSDNRVRALFERGK